MLKTISAALLAVSMIAAPALAATATKSATAPVAKTATAPVIKAEQTKSKKVLNANARMGHHVKHVRHHRHHKHMGMQKTHASPKLAVKHIAPVKRG